MKNISTLSLSSISLLLICKPISRTQLKIREPEMAGSRAVLRSATIFLTEPTRPVHFTRISSSFSFGGTRRPFTRRLYCNATNSSRVRRFHFPEPTTVMNCSYYEPSASQGPPQEAVLKAISEVSKTEGRIGQTTNIVIGGTVTDDSTNEWISLDQKVNSYPGVRDFTAIGTGGDDFVQSMVVAVESVLLLPIPQGKVRHKLSSKGKYVSVNIGPVQVISSEQVQAVYNAMKRDDRMKYFL